MKFTVQMKDPDSLYEAIQNAVVTDLAKSELDADEKALLAEHRTDSVAALCSQWFRYNEYLSVEIDTDAKTCTVLSVKS